jgi:hypothetical protein
MRKKMFLAAVLALCLAMPLGSAFAVESFVQPSGVIQYNAAKSYGGYQLFSGTGAGNRNSYLMDMEGYVIHEWHTNYIPSLHDQLLQNGNLVRAQAPPATQPLEISTPLMLMKQPYTIGGGHGGLIQEFDWDGNLVWEYALNDATHVQHHTFTRNETTGNTLILGWEQKSYAEAVAKGRNPATVDKTRGLWPDYAIEVDHNTPANIVWEFHVWDNLIQNFDPSKPNYGNPKDNPDKIDINWINPGMAVVASQTQDWTHWNTLNYHPTDSNKIIANSRHFGESYIIDKAAKKFIYRFGNPSAYGAGVAPSFQSDGDQLIFGPHHAHIIGPGLDGAGHLMILDNGWNRPAGNRTRVIEVDMTRTSGAAGNTAGTLHPGWIVWQYAAARPNSMYSASQCSNDRLPNGNTSITITETGHIIEVTKGTASGVNWINKEVVWEFINPLESTTTAGYVTFPVVRCIFSDSAADGAHNPTSIHRSTRYGTDYAAFQNKDMSQKYLMAQGCPEAWKMLDYTTGWTAGWNALQVPAAAPLTGWGFGSFGTSTVTTTTSGTGCSGGGGAAGGAGGGGGGY